MKLKDLFDLANIKAPPKPGQLFPAGFAAGQMPVYPLTFPGWQDTDTDTARAKQALQSAWVFSDIGAIAREMSTAQLIVKQQVGEEREDINNHEFEILWRRPNPFMGQAFLCQYWAFQKYLFGEAYLFFSPARNRLAEIWPVPSNMMRPVADNREYISHYEFRSRPDKDPIRLDRQFICYSRFPHPFDAHRGLSPLASAWPAIETDIGQQKWNREFFGKGNAIPTAVISTRADVSTTDFLRFRQELFDFFGSGQRRTMVARGGEVDVKLLALGQKEMDFVAGRAFTRDEIDRVFGIPAGFWQASATEANARHAKAVLIENAVWPNLVSLAQDLDSQIIDHWYDPSYTVEFEDIRPRDRDLEIREAQSRRIYWTVNELRTIDGMEPLPGAIWEDTPAEAALRAYGQFGGMLPPGAGSSHPSEVESPDRGDIEAVRGVEIARLRRWAKKRKNPDVAKFESDILTDTEKRAILGQGDGDAGDAFFRGWDTYP